MTLPTKIIQSCFYLLVILVPLIFLPNTSELFEFNKMIITYLLTTVIAGAWVIDIILQKKFIFRRTSLDWPILLFLLSNLISLSLSIDVRTSMLGYYSRFNGGFVSLLCYSLLYWAYVTFMDKKSSLVTINCLLFTAALISFYGVLEHFGIDAHLWVQDVQNRVFSTLGQPNWLAAYIVTLIFIPLAYLTSSPSPKFWRGEPKGVRWYLAFGSSLLLFLTLLFTKSRSGLLAFGISSAVYWGIYFWKLGKFEIRTIRNFVFFILLTLTLTITISNPLRDLFLKSQVSNLKSSQGTALETGGTESGAIRKIVWNGSLAIWKSSPKNFLFGSGPETFAMAYYQFRPIEHNNTSEWELLYNKAHNEFLNYLATTGLFGLISYLILLCSMLYIFIKSQILKSKSETNSNIQNSKIQNYLEFRYSYLGFGLLAGWLAIPITNFWGFSVVVMNIFLFLFPAMAKVLEQESEEVKGYQPAQNISGVQILLFLVSCSLTLILIYFIGKYWLADVRYASGQKYLKSFSQTQEPTYLLKSYEDLLSAYNLNKSDSPISSDLATVIAYLALLTVESDATSSSKLAQTSILLAQKTIDQSPAHPNYYKSFSRTVIVLSSLNSDYLKLALNSLIQAQKISPTDPRIPFNLGIIAKYQTDYSQAEKYLLQSLSLKPDFPDPKLQLDEIASISGRINNQN